MESARIKGTASTPVVAPDASNAIAKNSGEVNNARMKINKYDTVNILYRGILKTILIKPNETNTAKPTDTTMTILLLDIPSNVTKATWLARTSNPGSAIDTKKPRSKPETAIIQSLLFLVRLVAIRPPKGVTPISTPIRKTVNPKIIKTEPIKNLMIKLDAIGKMVKFSINTIKIIGSTDANTSLSF
jgi:hypothetical protein